MIPRFLTRSLAFGLAVSGAVLVTACLDTETPTVPSYQYQVSVSPDTLRLRQDSTSGLLAATLTNETLGKQVDSTGLVYSTANSAIAALKAVTGGYAVTAGTPGTTVVRVRYLNRYADSVVVVVSPRPAAAVDLTPNTASLLTGDTLTLAATLTDANAATIATRKATIKLAGADTLLATITSGGLLTAKKPGTAHVVATYKNTSLATAPAAADTATVTDTTVITITQAPVASITLTPTSGTVAVGKTLTFVPKYTAANGSVTVPASTTWTSADTGIATVSPTGVVTGVAAGATTITLTADGVTVSAGLTVTP